MPTIFIKLLITLIVALIVSVIPFDATIKRVCYIIIGVFVLLLLLAYLFGLNLAA